MQWGGPFNLSLHLECRILQFWFLQPHAPQKKVLKMGFFA